MKKLNVFFWVFLLAHTIAWSLGPYLLRASLPHDTLEGITWGMQWQFGYSKHPFLTAWLCAGVTHLFQQVGLPVYILAQIAVTITFIAAWRLALKFLPAAHALIAALCLDGVLFYNMNSFNFTPDSLQSPLWALFALSLYSALYKPRLLLWLSVGFLGGLCFCTKYQVLLLFTPIALFFIMNKQMRQQFAQPGIYWAMLVFLLTISPHVWWLYQHDFITLTYALESPNEYTPVHHWYGHLTYFFRFLFNNLLNISSLLLLLWPFYKQKQINLMLQEWQWQYLLCISFGPIILSLLLCMITGNHFPSRWATPYYFSLGIVVMVYLRPILTFKTVKQFVMTLLCFSTLILGIRSMDINMHWNSKSDAFIPNQIIAKTMDNLWHKHYHQPLAYVAGSNYLVSMITPYIPERTTPFLNWSQKDSPWINEAEVRKHGALFIWDVGQNFVWDKNSSNNTSLPSVIRKRYPRLIVLPTQHFRRVDSDEPIHIGVAVLPPEMA